MWRCAFVAHYFEAALLGACWFVCVERSPWCGMGFGMDVFLLALRGGCEPVLSECMRVICYAIGCFHVFVCAWW